MGYFFPDCKPGKFEHTIGVNWIRLWFEFCYGGYSELDRNFKVYRWKYEDKYPKNKGALQTDATVVMKDQWNKSFRVHFAEFDRGTNPFDKIPKYTDCLTKEYFKDEWWFKAGLTDGFPPILVVTNSTYRAKKIQEIITEQNNVGLYFDVRLFEDIKKEVIKKCCEY